MNGTLILGLYNLDQDPAEQYDIAKERPDVVAALRRMADEHTRGVVPVEDQIAPRAAPAIGKNARP